ncbi:ADP-heptose synthase [Paenibacillus apiarius]|uniref:ADP-heptose synthase n=1 Tax=Paenibacillus apiarius TaxID=46240 RepID=A0ABT4DNE7_9BACL|nr:ADP-heptose synthase [Paenibacillus apiarius]MBN3524028.1 ADP-heptose synthase [Paenibacillus apiarius]MCY9515478.1 ADP-heptose synthase [Paenibacillus apiarius]MCY9518887.1 ADP-heptose synthase [Paenibacillus apiarius]MCY9552067.1 ADP-heptose synthase [Paenibacillus apiarius]MCY9557257.1 ADP-heptose synthase [Paenibacillus apiarius]
MKPRRFVIEAVMLAVYGQLFTPKRPVEYIIPYTTIMELYEMRQEGDQVMPDPEDDVHAKQQIEQLITFFESELNKKKIERALTVPWRQSPPLLLQDNVSCIIVNAMDNARYGELFDPVETELILTALREQAPLLTDQFEYVGRLIENEIPIPIYDIDDFDYALEQEDAKGDSNMK